MIQMSSIINGKKYLNLNIGNLTYSLNTEDLTSPITIPLPQTIEKKPFGLQLFYNLNDTNVGQYANFGKGISFSYQLSFLDKTEEDNCIYVVDILGTKKKFVKSTDSNKIYINELDGQNYSYKEIERIIIELFFS